MIFIDAGHPVNDTAINDTQEVFAGGEVPAMDGGPGLVESPSGTGDYAFFLIPSAQLQPSLVFKTTEWAPPAGIQVLFPGAYVYEPETELAVKTVQRSTCYYKWSYTMNSGTTSTQGGPHFMGYYGNKLRSPDGMYHYGSIHNLVDDALYTVELTCFDKRGGKSTKEFQFETSLPSFEINRVEYPVEGSVADPEVKPILVTTTAPAACTFSASETSCQTDPGTGSEICTTGGGSTTEPFYSHYHFFRMRIQPNTEYTVSMSCANREGVAEELPEVSFTSSDGPPLAEHAVIGHLEIDPRFPMLHEESVNMRAEVHQAGPGDKITFRVYTPINIHTGSYERYDYTVSLQQGQPYYSWQFTPDKEGEHFVLVFVTDSSGNTVDLDHGLFRPGQAVSVTSTGGGSGGGAAPSLKYKVKKYGEVVATEDDKQIPDVGTGEIEYELGEGDAFKVTLNEISTDDPGIGEPNIDDTVSASAPGYSVFDSIAFEPAVGYEDAEVCFYYGDVTDDPSNLRIVKRDWDFDSGTYTDGSSWLELSGFTIDTDARTICAPTEEFSVFILGRKDTGGGDTSPGPSPGGGGYSPPAVVEDEDKKTEGEELSLEDTDAIDRDVEMLTGSLEEIRAMVAAMGTEELDAAQVAKVLDLISEINTQISEASSLKGTDRDMASATIAGAKAKLAELRQLVEGLSQSQAAGETTATPPVPTALAAAGRGPGSRLLVALLSTLAVASLFVVLVLKRRSP